MKPATAILSIVPPFLTRAGDRLRAPPGAVLAALSARMGFVVVPPPLRRTRNVVILLMMTVMMMTVVTTVTTTPCPPCRVGASGGPPLGRDRDLGRFRGVSLLPLVGFVGRRIGGNAFALGIAPGVKLDVVALGRGTRVLSLSVVVVLSVIGTL